MKFKILNIILILIFCNFFICYANAEYLAPTKINDEELFNIYDLIDIKNGIVENKSDSILGKGKTFYLNDNLFSIYENSVVYKVNEIYEPIEETTYSYNGYQINLPQIITIDINKNPFYLTKKQVKNYFELDIESKGILYEKNIKKNNTTPIGVTFSFLKENIESLGYEYIDDDTYQYTENGEINNIIYFYEDEIKIHWMYLNSNQDILNLVLQSLYPKSYITICNNLINIEGIYDNRYFKSTTFDNYVELEIKNNFS